MRSTETFVVVAGNDSISLADIRSAAIAIKRYFLGRDEIQVGLAAVRWKFVLNRVETQSDGTYFRMLVEPRVGAMRVDDMGRRVAIYKAPAGAANEIENDERFVYRGMAWEEWQATSESCTIGSRGTLNIDQRGMTFFGKASTAKSYASDYATLAFRPTKNRPGVIIAIPRDQAISHDDEPRFIPVDEWATRGRVPAATITGLWYVVPTYIRQGILDVIAYRDGSVDDGRKSGPMQTYAIVGGNDDRVRARCASSEYATNDNRSRRRRK